MATPKLKSKLAAAQAALPSTATPTKKKTKRVPVYEVVKLGTVSVDVGTIIIADPCRINRIAATQPPWADDDPTRPDMVNSPLMPRGTSFNTKTGEGTVEELAREIIDPAVPSKVPKPTKLSEFGTSEGKFVTLDTGFGDGYFDVMAEVVNYGGMMGKRIAAIHMLFVNAEDIEPYRGSKKKIEVEVNPFVEMIEYNQQNHTKTGKVVRNQDGQMTVEYEDGTSETTATTPEQDWPVGTEIEASLKKLPAFKEKAAGVGK
jgi:hypothetical protein